MWKFPYRAIKTNIAESLNIIIQIERRPGVRFVVEVVEIRAYDPETDRYELESIYVRQEQSCGTTHQSRGGS